MNSPKHLLIHLSRFPVRFSLLGMFLKKCPNKTHFRIRLDLELGTDFTLALSNRVQETLNLSVNVYSQIIIKIIQEHCFMSAINFVNHASIFTSDKSNLSFERSSNSYRTFRYLFLKFKKIVNSVEFLKTREFSALQNSFRELLRFL